LERARQRNAGKLLSESREFVDEQPHAVKEEKPAPEEVTAARSEASFAPSLPLSEISAPPPITTVLHDVYQDETGTSN
jgi:hypothetical protein